MEGTSREPRGDERSLGTFIVESNEAILAEWERRVRELSVARPLPSSLLRTHMPHLLERIASTLDHRTAESTSLLGEVAYENALARLGEGFDLRAATRELWLLRDVLL